MKTACLALILTVASAHAADLPFAGNWKVCLPQQDVDVSPWVVKIGPDGKKVTLVAGLNQYAKTKVGDVKADAKSVSFALSLGPNKVQVTALPPSGKDKDLMLGSVQINSNILPVWLRRTTVEELTPANASRPSPGFKELQEAAKLTDLDERRKKLDAILAAHAGQPVNFLTLQQILGDQVRQNAKPEAIQKTVAAYRELAARHGELFLIGANLDLTRNLLGQKAGESAAIDSAREATRLLRPDHPPVMRMAAYLMLAEALHAGGKEEETKAAAARAAKAADELIGAAKNADETFAATGNLARTLLSSRVGPVADQGLALARRTVKLLEDDAPVLRRAEAYRLLGAALQSRGKLEEVEKLEPVLAKIEAAVDVVYEKELFSFKIDKAARKGDSDRVVLVELFTNAPTPQVVAATIAFEAARKAYAPKDVVFLQYHVMFPSPDSLVFPDGELRKAFYAADLEGLPSVFIDGKLTAPLGGAKHRGQNNYDVVREAIDKALPAEPGARVALSVSRAGETLTAKATVTGLKETGAKIRLRFALVEDRIRYEGKSGVRLHSHVVRSFIGGAGGQRLDKKEVTHSASLNLAQLRRTLGEYLDGLAKKDGVQSPVKPLELKKLKVIAWVQDEESKQVLGAAQADVPAK